MVPLLGIHIYILLIWDGSLGWGFHSQHSLVLVLRTRDIHFCNTSSLGGLIFVSLRHDFESLVGLPSFLLHFHNPKFLSTPQGVPPSCGVHDHSNRLVPCSLSPSFHPYHYPLAQNN
jgi:hypothetical protein